MTGFEKILDGFAGNPNKFVEDGDYTGEDGLIYCGRCRTPKQYRLYFGDKIYIVPCICRCMKEKRDEEERLQKLLERKNYIEHLKAQCIQDAALRNYTFENDDGSLEQIESAHRYVESWEKRLRNNDGLLLWGNTGTGKTFYAACIANALLEKGVSVLMTNFAKILNELSGFYSTDKNKFIEQIMKFDLLVLDDFGIERNTEYALEQVYNVIDERYKTGKPLIVTTNLSLKTLRNPPDLAHRRINDRLLSMCVPICFSGENHRVKDREEKMKNCEDLFL